MIALALTLLVAAPAPADMTITGDAGTTLRRPTPAPSRRLHLAPRPAHPPAARPPPRPARAT
ncbi:hypothetical protein [Nannocystis pusilla]|uniref:hypothetical protein n=1 Tax=Nannocystis pusilla TaxID=889268 RepID=UPI003B7F169A